MISFISLLGRCFRPLLRPIARPQAPGPSSNRRPDLAERISAWEAQAAKCDAMGLPELARIYRTNVRTYRHELALARFGGKEVKECS